MWPAVARPAVRKARAGSKPYGDRSGRGVAQPGLVRTDRTAATTIAPPRRTRRARRGEFFGERSLFGSEKRNASIQARTVVELVVLQATSFQQLLRQFPDVAASIVDAKEEREAETRKAQSQMINQRNHQAQHSRRLSRPFIPLSRCVQSFTARRRKSTLLEPSAQDMTAHVVDGPELEAPTSGDDYDRRTSSTCRYGDVSRRRSSATTATSMCKLRTYQLRRRHSITAPRRSSGDASIAADGG